MGRETMIIRKTAISGILVIEPDVYHDSRGSFAETWSARRLAAEGFHETFVQDNISWSTKGVLRGLHFQNPVAQGKLLSVLMGEVFDVAVDLRIGSPTFGKWYGGVLSKDNLHQLYVPPGFAHGFVVLSDLAIFHYKCTASYNKDSEKTLLWNDPDLGIEWPIKNPIVSEKDNSGKSLKQFSPDDLFRLA
jgi:dTDP-4-dehydrorhamnose 3,5-epimerase